MAEQRRRSGRASSIAAAMVFFGLNLLFLLAAADDDSVDELQNWTRIATIVPGPPSTISPPGSFAYAHPKTIAEVQAVVGDTTGKYPSPVLTVGSGHSSGNVVSVVNSSSGADVYRGTILQMTGIKGIALEEEVAAVGGGAGGGGGSSGKRRSLRRLRRHGSRRLEGVDVANAPVTVTVAPGGETPPSKKYYVRVGGGVTLADLHDWLAERNLEISYSPEIGDATVGSCASTTMKDSSVRGSQYPQEEQRGVTYPPYPSSSIFKGMGEGHLNPLVRGLRYVNATGDLVELDARRSPSDAARIRRFGGSYGLMGPVVDVLLETRPLALVDFKIKVVAQEAEDSNAAFASKLLALRNECDNMLTLISLGGVAKTGSTVQVDPHFERPWAYVELRTRRYGPDAQKIPLLNKLTIDWWWPELFRQIKYRAFFLGELPQWIYSSSRIPGVQRTFEKIVAIKDRRFFVNRYKPTEPGKPREAFSYYEIDLPQLPGAIAAMLSLAEDYRKRTGWSPGVLAIYFIKRDGVPGESNYGGSPGVSCTLDPVTGAPEDPLYRQFLAESDRLLMTQFGAALSPSQSLPQLISPGQATNFGWLDPSYITHSRFATPYLKQCWAADALWKAQQSGGKKK